MHIHILGICGTFMGGLAVLAKEAGHRVTGCDANVYPPMSTQLEEQGIELIEGYDAEQMKLAAANGANSYTIKPANAEQFLRTVLASTNYWLTIHQYPGHHLPPEACRR